MHIHTQAVSYKSSCTRSTCELPYSGIEQYDNVH